VKPRLGCQSIDPEQGHSHHIPTSAYLSGAFTVVLPNVEVHLDVIISPLLRVVGNDGLLWQVV
jgi:hypothetical protein